MIAFTFLATSQTREALWEQGTGEADPGRASAKAEK
jgi:hypothetical protein